MIRSPRNTEMSAQKAVATITANGSIVADSTVAAINKVDTATTTMTAVELDDVDGRPAAGSYTAVASVGSMDILGSLEPAPLCRRSGVQRGAGTLGLR
jgi:hypothetical protein